MRPTKARRRYIRRFYGDPLRQQPRSLRPAAAWWLTLAGRRRRGEFSYATRVEWLQAAREAVGYARAFREERLTATRCRGAGDAPRYL